MAYWDGWQERVKEIHAVGTPDNDDDYDDDGLVLHCLVADCNICALFQIKVLHSEPQHKIKVVTVFSPNLVFTS